MNIRYCLSNGWGGAEAAEADVEANMLQAGLVWSGNAKVKFVHVAGEDGSDCDQDLVGNTVDFIVKPNVGDSNTSYAWFYYAVVQEVAIGSNAGTVLPIFIHELGHALGVDHEQQHPDSGLGCGGNPPLYGNRPAGFSWYNQSELTAYDPVSIMHYYSNPTTPACSGGNNPAQRPSALDGVGMRALYGNPDWWAAIL